MMKKTAIILLLLFTVQMCRVLPVYASSSIRNYGAYSSLLIECESGTILHPKGNTQSMHNKYNTNLAARVMTLLLAAEAIENDEISDNELIEMSEAAWLDISEISTTQSIQPGQMLTFIDLIYSAYTGSANEASNMIALTVAGSVDSFVRMMNAKADEFGCTGTNFVSPHGQYDPDNYTTAYDLYTIYNEALKSDLFEEVAGTYRHVTERTEDTESRTLVSPNSMLNQNSIYYYRYCTSGLSSSPYENGYSAIAVEDGGTGGFSLVAAAEEDGLTLISVVFGVGEVINEDESVTLRHFSAAHEMFMWGYENFGWRDILKRTDLLARVPVLHGSGADYVNVRPERPLTLLLETSVTTESFDMDIVIFSERDDTPLVAPVSSGDVLGEVTVSRNGVTYDTIALIANTDIELNGLEFMRRQIFDILSTPLARNIIIVLLIIVVIYAALVIRYNIMRVNRLRRIRNAKNELIREKYDNNKH